MDIDQTRCDTCTHLKSFHGEEGCSTWLLGVRAVPLYRCACICTQDHIKDLVTNEGPAINNSMAPQPKGLEALNEPLRDLATSLDKMAETLQMLEDHFKRTM